MISICTVTYGNMDDYTHVFVDSIRCRTRHVTEVVIVKVDAPQDGLINEWRQGQIHFRVIGYNLLNHLQGYKSSAWAYMVCGHTFGLHHALENSTGEYIWFSDPDLFFLNTVDQIYLDLMSKHNLDIVGISHFNAKEQSYGYFPCVINCLVKKADLPDSDWLEDQLWIRSGMQLIENPQPLIPTPGKFLISFPIPEFQDQFPNPHGMFDTGCNLWIWNQQRGGRWLAFYLDQWHTCFRYNRGFNKLLYPLNYNTARYKTNFGLEDALGKEDLLYHRTRSALENGSSFRELYHRLFNTSAAKTRTEARRAQAVHRLQRPTRGYIKRDAPGRTNANRRKI